MTRQYYRSVSGLALAMGLLLSAPAWAAPAPGAPERPHNLIIFVADGLRSSIVSPDTAPALAAIRRDGVDFHNSHSLYPTITTPNASAIATGHRLGDTGDFANTLFADAPALPAAYGALVAPVEDDGVLGDLNARFEGNYLNETTLLAAARAAGFSTAAVGKLGPTAIQDVTARDGATTVVIDDETGQPDGLPLSTDIAQALKAAKLGVIAPDRGLNADPGDFIRSGVHVSNAEQQDWFVQVATQVLLPRFKAADRPFALVFWSRDPDGTQHNTGDSLNSLTPGINGPTSLAAIRNASDDLQRLRDALKAQGLDQDTDIVVTADHGFSVTSKQSQTSAAAKMTFRDVPAGFLPPGFLGIDLSKALGLPLFESSGLDVELSEGFHPRQGGVILGADPQHPDIVIGINGGSDAIWLPTPAGRALAPKIVEALVSQDYTGAVFTTDDLGAIPGALPTSLIGLKGSALTPAPAIMVSFRSFSTGCDQPEICGAEVADTTLQQGQGIHGSFGRQDTHNFMAAIGPDFKAGFVDPAPVSNADLAITLAKVLGLDLKAKGHETGRVLAESLKGGETPASTSRTVRSAPAQNGFVTVLNLQESAGQTYFDAAGAPDRTLGLKP
ncbi:MAG: alkaline phosphatase family protein [Caulobacteraceae bacterium]|nr:alkaline phosphatase family protein [Caulobacteraceae bacterium]